MIGLIGGSSLLESEALASLAQEQVVTPYGKVLCDIFTVSPVAVPTAVVTPILSID